MGERLLYPWFQRLTGDEIEQGDILEGCPVFLPPDDLAEVTLEKTTFRWEERDLIVIKSRDLDKIARAYEGLLQVVDSATRIKVLPFSRPALKRYLELRHCLPRLGKLDLSIAAIALEHQGILVTGNRADFEQVPWLPLEELNGDLGGLWGGWDGGCAGM